MGSRRFVVSSALIALSLSPLWGCSAPTLQDGPGDGHRLGLSNEQETERPVDRLAKRLVEMEAKQDSDARSAAKARQHLAQLELLTEGATALSSGDPALAADLLAAFLEFEPDNGMALFLRGVALLDLGATEQAQALLIAATEAEPEDASSFAVLARIEFELGHGQAAIAAIRRSTELAPEVGQHWTSLGLLHFEQEHWNQAYDALLRAVELDEQDDAAHRALGRLYLNVGELALAERAFRTASSLVPDDASLQVVLGHVLRDLDRREDSLLAYRMALELEQDNPWTHANMASVLLELGRPHEARPHFEQALAQLEGAGPDGAFVFLNYGGMLEGVGDLDGAQTAYEWAIEEAPGLAVAHEALGELHLNLGDRKAAQESLARADALGTLRPETLLELTFLWEEGQDWGAAKRCAGRLLQGVADDEHMAFLRARLLLRSRHPAVRDPAAAVELLLPLVTGAYQNHPASWELLCDAFTTIGEVEEAIEALDGALRAPNVAQAMRTRFEARRERLLSRLQSDP